MFIYSDLSCGIKAGYQDPQMPEGSSNLILIKEEARHGKPREGKG